MIVKIVLFIFFELLFFAVGVYVGYDKSSVKYYGKGFRDGKEFGFDMMMAQVHLLFHDGKMYRYTNGKFEEVDNE